MQLPGNVLVFTSPKSIETKSKDKVELLNAIISAKAFC